jgi:hypothetical protein
MEERGISPDELRKAIQIGSKDRKSSDEYIGTYGACTVKVKEAPCTLYVITTWVK